MSRNGNIRSFFGPKVISKLPRVTDEAFAENIVVASARSSDLQVQPAQLQDTTSKLTGNKDRVTARMGRATSRATKEKGASVINVATEINIPGRKENTPPPRQQQRSTSMMSPGSVEMLESSSRISSPCPSSPDSLPADPIRIRHERTTAQKRTISSVRQPLKPVNTSFDSISTLSTLPPSSQMSQSSASRRIVLNGVEAVTNSSSDAEPLSGISEESEDCDTSDSDSFADIDELIAQKRRKMAEQPPTPTSMTIPAQDDRQLRSSRRPVPGRARYTPASPPRKIYKHDLAALVKQKRKDDALSARINELEQSIVGIEPSQDETMHDTARSSAIDFGLPTGGDDDAENEHRLKQAMQRADALESEVRFHFFHDAKDHISITQEFPISCLPKAGWATMMADKSSRDHVVLSGFAEDLAAMNEFPAEVQEWMLGEILVEQNEEMSYAYIGVLNACARHRQLSTLLDMPMLRDCLERLGARSTILEDEEADPACNSARAGQCPRQTCRKGLQYFLLLLSRTSKRLQPAVRQAAFYYLALMLIDHDLTSDMSMIKQLQDTLTILTSHLDSEGDMSNLIKMSNTNITRVISNPILTSRLIDRLPSSTPNTCFIRRNLALAFFLQTAYTHDATTSPSTWRTITTMVHKDKTYALTDRTDYTLLSAHINILDIALGAGFSDFAFLNPNSSSANDTEASFNASVDTLASALRNLSSHIRDAGAAHLRRTECKTVIDRVAARLQFAVRTKVKPKQGIFGTSGKGAWSGMEGLEGIMEKYVKRNSVPA